MAYQNVGTPRFYINVMEWLSATGYLSSLENIYRTLPVNPTAVVDKVLSLAAMTNKGFVVILGHNFQDIDNYAELHSDGTAIELSNVVNSVGGATVHVHPSYNGFSIATFSEPDIDNFWVYSHESTAGSIIIGTYYDMPHSPDLSLTLTRDYSGIKTIETKGGASLSNSFYSKPPMWGTLGAWEISNSTTNQQLSRSARRIWDLSFSYLSAKDIMAAPEVVDQTAATESIAGAGSAGGTVLTDLGWDSDDIDDNDSFAFSILDHNNFYSQVVHRLNGGQLPFIFQPDSSNNSPDAFAIAKLDMKSFSFQQTAPNLYSVKMKIREVW